MSLDGHVVDTFGVNKLFFHNVVLAGEPLVYSTIRNILFVKFYVAACITILYFDHAITFPEEVRRVWKARFTGATVLFLLNRYIPFIGYIPIILSLYDPPFSIHQCAVFGPFVGALSCISNVITTIILVLRTYALYNRSLRVLLLTSTIGLASIGISSWSASSVKGTLFSFKPVFICIPLLESDEVGLRLAWVATFVFDSLVFGLTMARTHKYLKTQTRLQLRTNLPLLIMRDGSIYFLVLSVVNAVNIILDLTIENSFFTSATGTNSMIAHVISVTMISRLLLNLREEAVQAQQYAGAPAETVTQTVTDTRLVFTSRIIGNLTADLDYNDHAYSSEGSHNRSWNRSRHGDNGGDNYCSYAGENTDEFYELQSFNTGARSGYTSNTWSDDPTSSSGTGTYAGTSSGAASSSGSGSHSGRRESDRGKATRGVSRRKRNMAWKTSVNTASSSIDKDLGLVGEYDVQTPATAVEPSLLLLPLLPNREHGGAQNLLSPISPTTMNSTSPTLVQPSPLSSVSPHFRRFNDQSELEDVDEGGEADIENGNSRGDERPRIQGSTKGH